MRHIKKSLMISLLCCGILFFLFSSISIGADADWQPIRTIKQLSGTAADRNHQVMIRTLDLRNELMQFQYSIPEPTTEKSSYFLTNEEISSSGLEQFRQQIWQKLNLSSMPLKKTVGKPELPYIPVQLIIPQGYSTKDIRVVFGQEYQFPQTVLLEPGSQPIPLLPGAKAVKTLPNAAIYQLNQFIPESTYELVSESSYRGLKVLQLNISPVKYNPATGQLVYYKDFTLTVETMKNSNRAMGSELKYRPTEELGLFLNQVENPASAASYREDADTRQTYKLLIVTNATFANATGTNSLQDFKTHKINMGVTTTIETIESIYSSSSGTDNADKLRNHIRNRYNEWGIEYVLLVGDINIIPHRSLYCISWEGEGNYTDNIPSDLYFSCLDGTYNSDNDSSWGETTDGPNGADIDLLMDVVVGRASADTTTNVTAWVKKSKKFDTDAPSSAYKKKLLMVGEHLGFGGISEYAKPHLMDIINGSSDHGFTTAGFAADSSYSYEGLFDMDGTWAVSTLKTKMNSNQFGIINHLGHANSTYVMKMYSSDVTGLTNSTYFFAYSQGCYPGSFDTDNCMAEYFTTNANNGAFAVIFNSRYGWGANDSTDGVSGRFNREFWDAMFAENYSRLGDMFADQKHDLRHRINEACMRWCYYEISLFGDPTVSFRDKVRADFSYTKSNKTLNFIDKSFTPTGSITGWQWNFGDGATSTLQNPTRTYATEGYYNVTLTVNSSSGSHTKVQKVYAGTNEPPCPIFYYDVDGSKYDFWEYSSDPDGYIASWAWNFGDGATSTERNPVHTYSAHGTYTVTLTCTDNLGKSASATDTILITTTYCASKGDNYTYFHIANVKLGTLNNNSAGSGYTDFTSTVAAPELLPNQTYTLTIALNNGTYTNWFKAYIDYNNDGDFEDSGEIIYNSTAASKVQSITGSVTIPAAAKTGLTRMRIQAKNSAEPTPCETIPYGEVEDYLVKIGSSCTPPTANFTWQINPQNPCVVDFTDTSTDNDGDTIVAWDWKFGDGWFSTLQNPSYNYNANGTFEVTLDVTNSCGENAGIVKTIEVTGCNNECVYDHLVGSFPGIGIWLRDSQTAAWTQLSKQQADIIRVGDINGNGLDDIAAYFKTTKKLWYRYDNGIWEDIPASAATLLVFDLGDMNDDGKEDLVGGWTDKGLWWRNSANGVWTKISNMVPDLVAAADFNGDNKADIVGKFPSLNSIWIYYSDNTWKQISKQVNLVDLRAGNMDNDAEAELVGSWDIGVWMFDPATNNWVKHHNDQAKQITVGDINAQCMQDIVGYWSTATPLYVKFMENNTWQKLSNYNPDTMDAGKVK